MKKNYTESIARVFEIIGYILIIPGSLAVIMPTAFAFEEISSGDYEKSLFCIGCTLIYLIGVILFIGYIRHSRGKLNNNKIIPLWGVTAIYNFIPFGFAAGIFIKSYLANGVNLNEFSLDGFEIIPAIIFFWWITATALSLSAIYFQCKDSEKYL